MGQKSSGGGASADTTVTPFRDVNADSAQRRIADDLRQARLARGAEIAEAAATLRIRGAYLAALEEGRFADLPGPTYVAGFLRAYGRFLELDGDELVRRYKDETGGVLVRQQLNFPVPASEARQPTGTMVAAALAIALIVAGAWYILEQRGRADLELVPAVPEEIAAAAGVGEADVAALPAAGDVDTVTAEAAAVEADVAIVEAETAAVEAEVAAVDAGADAGEADAAAVDGEAAEAAQAEVAGEIAAIAEPADEELAAADVAAASDAAAEAAGDEVALAAEDGYVPRVYGGTNADSRVEVRALAETWIQVEGPGGEMLLTRVLLPGDIYRVPNRDDVTLDTGNAGGLELRVDGQPIAPLGEPGVVLRNIPLAPEELLAR